MFYPKFCSHAILTSPESSLILAEIPESLSTAIRYSTSKVLLFGKELVKQEQGLRACPSPQNLLGLVQDRSSMQFLQ